MHLARFPLVAGLLLVSTAASHGVDGSPSVAGLRDDSPLKQLQEYIGSWKGVGQVRRGSTQGAWIEESGWAWKFGDGEPAVVFAAPASKHLRAGRITVDPTSSQLRLAAQTAAGGELQFTGERRDDGSLRFIADAPKPGAQQPGAADLPAVPSRVTLRLAAEGKRLVVLLERRIGPGDDAFAQLAEIGYTRVGSEFGKDTGGRKCIVTGGEGTIAVSHQGKTYYVCCSGCQELFRAEPEKIIAEYQARLASKK